jgi:hydrogenase maturation factor
MCLTIPKQVISVNKDIVKLKSENQRENAVSIIKVRKNDWVLTQQNVIIKKISPKQAKDILKIINNHKSSA